MIEEYAIVAETTPEYRRDAIALDAWRKTIRDRETAFRVARKARVVRYRSPEGLAPQFGKITVTDASGNVVLEVPE